MRKPKPKYPRLTFRIPAGDPLWALLAKYVRDHETPYGAVIRAALYDYLMDDET